MGRLMSGLNPLEIFERRVYQAFVGQPVPGSFPFEGQPVPEPFPFETLGSVWPARGAGSGPKVPTMPPFSYREGKPSPAIKRVRLTVVSWGIVYY